MTQSLNIWDSLQTENPSLFKGNDARSRFLVSCFSKGVRVLNIGMGNGRFEELCLGRGIDVYTLDPSEKSVQMLRKKLNLGSKAVAGYSQAIPFADSFFDGVVMTEVIEHLSHEIMEKTFSEIKRVLKTGGLFTGTIPNNEDLNADMTICPKCGEKFTKWGHLQTFTVESFRKEVEKTFSVLKVESRLFTPWNILNWHGKIEAVARYCMFRTGTLGERWQNIFFLCKK